MSTGAPGKRNGGRAGMSVLPVPGAAEFVDPLGRQPGEQRHARGERTALHDVEALLRLDQYKVSGYLNILVTAR